MLAKKDLKEECKESCSVHDGLCQFSSDEDGEASLRESGGSSHLSEEDPNHEIKS